MDLIASGKTSTVNFIEAGAHTVKLQLAHGLRKSSGDLPYAVVAPQSAAGSIFRAKRVGVVMLSAATGLSVAREAVRVL